jgi:hypothetical protein
VNVTDGADTLAAHVDKPAWGDVVVVFTLDDIVLELAARGSGQKLSARVNALEAYMLAGPARYAASHRISMSGPRVGVVFRYHLKDVVALGTRASADGDVPVGTIVSARWPSQSSSISSHSKYRSAYPAVVRARRGAVYDLTFFANPPDVAHDAEVHTSLVLANGARRSRCHDARARADPRPLRLARWHTPRPILHSAERRDFRGRR